MKIFSPNKIFFMCFDTHLYNDKTIWPGNKMWNSTIYRPTTWCLSSGRAAVTEPLHYFDSGRGKNLLPSLCNLRCNFWMHKKSELCIILQSLQENTYFKAEIQNCVFFKRTILKRKLNQQLIKKKSYYVIDLLIQH